MPRPSNRTGLRPRRWPAATVLLALAFLFPAGCLGDASSDCEPLRDHAVVESMHGRDAVVRLPDGEPAVVQR